MLVVVVIASACSSSHHASPPTDGATIHAPSDSSPTTGRATDDSYPSTSTTTLPYKVQLRCLDEMLIGLTSNEAQLARQLEEELAAHSPSAGGTDAAHSAVLRQIAKVNALILQLQQGKLRQQVCASTSPAGNQIISAP